MKSGVKKRLHIKVYGIVQGVGFRPFVSRIAMRCGIYGSVCNKGSYVEIFAQAPESGLTAFLDALENEAPPRSVILKVKKAELGTVEETECGDGTDANNGRFNIIESSKEDGPVFVSPDIATCPDCERELFNPQNRRYLHPFINCTACGPRLTILDSMPYDRERTSMGEFTMCPECEYEYTHASTRRYHAQPVCCNDCGPELYIIGREERGNEALIYTRKIIREGGIAAVKGIGGFHLCCDALNADAVKRLRKLKHRPVKPFAVMMKDMDTVRRECITEEGQDRILTGPQKPIILLQKKDAGTLVCGGTAPGNPRLGVMLPYAPVQMLLFGYPDGETISDCFVMTSGNPSGAPICMDDEEAVHYLSPMCDAILSNPRKIRIRADDSVMSYYRDLPYMIRRSRGYAPLPQIMPESSGHSVLGIGGELKNTFCYARDDMYYPSPYIGDMADLRSMRALEAAEVRLGRLLEIDPEIIACDMHPGYNTTSEAKKLASEKSIPCIEVQHHHAHIASCMAENGFADDVIGVSFDGTGYGSDGTIWGGEFIKADLKSFERLGSIEPFTHAGGDLASKEGWRIAVSLLLDAYEDRDEALSVIDRLGLASGNDVKAQLFMLGNGVNTTRSTSAGRLFDAVSAVLGVRMSSSFESEASMALEFAAGSFAGSVPQCSIKMFAEDTADELFRLNTTGLARYIAEARLGGMRIEEAAALFHAELAAMITAGCDKCAEKTGLKTVALSGGVFQNILLLKLCDESLEKKGYRVLKHSLIPANDGGISLGQAVVAMASFK